MAGVLLTPGPITTHISVKRLSRIFNTAVSKTKFMTACRQLEAAGLGSLVNVGQNSHCFVKKPPAEIGDYLVLPENCDLATLHVFESRYNLPLSVVVKERYKQFVVAHGLVPPEAINIQEYSI